MDRNNGLVSVGEAARAAGVAATTLRFYEREGILQPTARSGSGYRLYDETAVARLRFIRAAQAVGFTLEDIKTLLELDATDNRVCQQDVQRMLEERLAEVERKMNELERVRGILGQALDRCRGSSGECPVLEELRPRKE